MTAFIHHFSYEFKHSIRNPMILFMYYLFPLGFYFLMATVMTSINPLFKDAMIPSMVIFTFMVSALLAMPGPHVDAREQGIFRSFKINGVPSISILGIPFLNVILHGIIVSFVIVITAPLLFKGTNPVNSMNFVLITALCAFVCGALGSLIGVISKSSRMTVILAQIIFLPSMLIGGLMMPLSILPEGIKKTAALLPTSHIMELYNHYAFGKKIIFEPEASIAVLVISGILALILSLILFNWDSQNKSIEKKSFYGLAVMIPYIVYIIYTL